MDKKISIIIPVYNISDYLSRCLDSVVKQTYTNLEIIVVNDGSSDGTEKQLDEWTKKDQRMKAIHQKNGGAGCARLNGVRAAMGDYIGFVDGDDFIEESMFERLMSNALEYEADISHCGYVMDFPDGHKDAYYNTGVILEQDRISGLESLLKGEVVEPSLCNKIFRRKLFFEIQDKTLLNHNIQNYEDLLMNYYLFLMKQ